MLEREKRESALVSIIIPADKNRQYIEETMASCLEQVYTNLEIIVITKDGENYESRLPQIKTVSYPEEMGYVEGYNRGIQEAKGEYIAFLKSGDIAMPERIALQLEMMQKDREMVLVCSDMSGIDEVGRSYYESYCTQYGIKVYEEEQTKHLVQTNFVSGSTILMTSAIKEQVFPLPQDLPYEDWWIGVIASIQGKIGFIEIPLVKHRESSKDEQSFMNRKTFMVQRVEIAKSNSIYYQAFADYFRRGKHHYLSVIQPMELRDTLMSTYSLKKRLAYYYSERTYMCRRKIRWKEKMKIQGYLWMGPYLLMIK